MRKNILITGCGFLATAVIKKLIADDRFTLVVLSRSAPRDAAIQRFIREGKIQFIPADISDPETLRRHQDILEQSHYLLHLAAVIPELASSDFLKQARENIIHNIQGTVNLLEFLPQLEYLCFSSSVSVYTQKKSSLGITEETTVSPDTPYGMSKLAVEHVLTQYGEMKNIPVTLLRFCQLYGPDEPHGMFITRMIAGATQGIIDVTNGEDCRDILFVDDAAEAVRLALEKRATGIYLIASGKAQRVQEVAAGIAAAYGPSVQVINHGASRNLLYISYDISRAQKELGFLPAHPLESGIPKTIHKKNE